MLIERNKYLQQIYRSIESVRVTVLIGARQTGKTSLLNSIKTKSEVARYDGQLPEVQILFSEIRDIVSALMIKLNEKLEGFLIIDEFQMINNISSTLKALVDNYPHLKIVCSGSSSLDIEQNVEESLAGRVRMIYVYSLSFSESLLFKKTDLFTEYDKYPLDTSMNIISPEIKENLYEQVIYGGMPRVNLTKDKTEKIRILDDIYKTYLLRDVRSYVKNEDYVGFNKLLRLLALQTSNLVNINELSRNSGLSYRKCENYVYLLEQMYIIKLIEPYESNRRKAIKKMKKVYFLDLGIRNILVQNFNQPEIRSDMGALFENFVFLEIIKNIDSYSIINFYRTRDGAEVDFIVNDMFKLMTFEVKHKALKKPVYYKAFTNFNEEQSIKESYVVNLELNYPGGRVRFIPAVLLEKIFHP